MNSCENSTGDHLFNNKNVQSSHYTFDSEDCSYCYDCGALKSSCDAFEPFKGELQYETHGCNLGYNLLACSKCYEDNALRYCQYCWYSSNLFGCFGLKRKSHCILNKQYSPEEYEKLAARIIKHMKETKEWGEFFPIEMSPFGYNETAARDYYPLTKEEVLKRGWKWKDDEVREPVKQTIKIPPRINDVPYSITDEILQCQQCEKNYRVILEEVRFYKNRGIPIPEHCPDCRHKTRIAIRNPRKLWQRDCTKCKKEIASTFSPDRKEIIYCAECYLEKVY